MMNLQEAQKELIARRLRFDLIGTGLLCIGALWLWLSPTQALIGHLIQFVAALVVAFGILKRGLRDIFRSKPHQYSDQIVAIAVLASCVYGDFVTATLVPLALDLGRLFEERTSLGIHSAIDKIHSLQVDMVTKYHNEQEMVIHIDQVQIGDVLLIKATEYIPVDGVVIFGQSKVNQAVLTGESKPVSVDIGHDVFAGTQNLQGVLRIQVVKIGSESALGRIVTLLIQAQETQIPLLQKIESWLGVYFPIALSLSATVLFLTEDFERAIAVLVVAFPSSLAIAGSATMISAFSKAASLSIFVKDARVFQLLNQMDTVVLDKTGTLTDGAYQISEIRLQKSPTLINMAPIDMADSDTEDIAQIAYCCAQYSNHPIAQAIRRTYANKVWTLPLKDVLHQAQEIPGNGVIVESDLGTYRMGRLEWLEKMGINAVEQPEAIAASSGTWIAKDFELLGQIALEDHIRPQSKDLIASLHDWVGEDIWMLTGDQESQAQRVAQEVGIVNIKSQAFPEDKLQFVQSFKAQGHIVVMMGDGINDALALQEADVGIAIGASIHQAAMGGADVALCSTDVSKMQELLQLARAVEQKILQNVALGIGGAVLMLYLASSGQVSPLMAAILHNIGALLVIANSSLLWVQMDEKSVTEPKN